MRYLIALFLLGAGLSATAQAITLAERLGYKPGDKLLIIHADDIGLSHSENSATLRSMTDGIVNSTSIMMPSGWAAEVGEYLHYHPNLDIGVHLTLTNEWHTYKWGPVASRSEVPGLVDGKGFMYASCAEVAEHAGPEEVEREMRAQIEAAMRIGIRPSHIDTHMGCVLFGRPEYTASYLKLSAEYRIPAMITPEVVEGIVHVHPELFRDVDVSALPVIDRIITAAPTDYEKGLGEFYTRTLSNLSPGVTALLLHVAYDDAEMQALTTGHPHWHAPWRQADFDFFTDEKVWNLIEAHQIKLITWQEIADAFFAER
jgi:chitin disaccharide deacetylase